MMPRRGNESQVALLPKKKLKLDQFPEPPPSLDVSFCDDEALPPGIVFSDIQQKKWRIGKPIGRGSFGRIYLASDETEKEVTKANARYVVKIEPHSNGPLFVEVHCLIRTAQVQKVKSWRRQNKQKRLGMPIYIASGSFTDENSGVKYRFLVLPRYDIDLQKVIARTRTLDLKNVLVLAIQILEVLEYFHNQGYTHSDIKSSNLMLGFDANKLNKVPSKTPSFQKETKEVAVLSGKQRRPKTSKARASNYYEDEDYIGDLNNTEEDKDKKLANVKSKLRKILSDKDNRTLHRHHAFNLRQLSNYVNYEDMSSSVCSDQSYQRLLDDFSNKPLIRMSMEFYEDVKKKNGKIKNEESHPLDEIHKEAILSQSNGQIYLLDYGLASKFLDSEGNHKDFVMDARKAHDGTLEYSSRDSHIGAHSRRSDLETLGYNLLDWLTGYLPWRDPTILSKPDLVHELKKSFMTDIKSFLKTCFKTEFYPTFIEKYLQYVTSLDFTDKPDYEYCKSLFKSELLKNGYDKDVSLNFEASMSPMSRKLCYSKRFGKKNTPSDFLARNGIKKSYERENFCSLENDLKLELLKQTLNSSSDGVRKPCVSRNFFVSDADLIARLKTSLMPHDMLGKKLSPKNLRSKKKVQRRRKHKSSIGKFGNFMGSARQFTWAEILAGNPEDIIRKERNTLTAATDDDDDDEEECKYRIRRLSNASSNSSDSNLPSPLLQKDYLQNTNPTYAMKEVLSNFKKKAAGKGVKDPEDEIDVPDGYTPAMIKMSKIKSKKETKDHKNTNSTYAMKEGLSNVKKKAASKGVKDPEDVIDVPEGYTPVMIKMFKIKAKRETKERLEALKQNTNKKEPIVVIQRTTRSGNTKSRINNKKVNSDDEKIDVDESPKPVRRTRQKVSNEKDVGKSDEDGESQRPMRKTRQNVSDDRKESETLKVTERKTRSTRKADKVETNTKIEEKVCKRSTRNTQKRVSSTESMEVDESVSVKVKANNKSVKNDSKKQDKTVESKAERCTKSPPRTKLSLPNRRRLRSDKRGNNLLTAI